MDETKTTKLCTVNDSIEAGMILDILKQHDIPAYKKALGCGQVVEIYTGSSCFGEEIFVNERDVEQAKELIVDIVVKEPGQEPVKRSKGQQIVVGTILGASILFLLYAILSSI